MKNAITVAILSKEFIERDWDNYTNDYNVFNYVIENKSKKEIKAAEIEFKIYNSLGKQLGEQYVIEFTDDRIAPGAKSQHHSGFVHNKYVDDDVKIASAKFEDLLFDFDIRKIVYSDGSVLE